ncbi:MAG: hypothetical protein KF884_09620 [Fimbriimonadaceae bacterium]|nr:hypothetical protein [Fimbriimonadaceae bacterium]QYK57805.1 MAG: hypothetical protein KF884_09620 [Fimbriimonadaceae bacterium]
MRYRLRDVLPFGKPKTPGFGISGDYFLSVLAGTAPLPPLLSVVAPKGAASDVDGLPVPLAAGSTKDDLTKPLERGVYAVASPDQKTVLKLRVVSKEEAGFDPQAMLATRLGTVLDDERKRRIAATWTILQLTFESHDPAVYPALDFFLAVVQALAVRTNGIVADPISQVYKLPEELVSPKPDGAPLAVQDFVSIERAADSDGARANTRGLIKFALPEVEIGGLDSRGAHLAERFLLGVSQSILRGRLLELGGLLGSPKSPFRVATGGLDRSRWEGIPVFELIPDGRTTTTECLVAWAESNPS